VVDDTSRVDGDASARGEVQVALVLHGSTVDIAATASLICNGASSGVVAADEGVSPADESKGEVNLQGGVAVARSNADLTVVELTERARLEASGSDAEAAIRGSLTLDGSCRGTEAESESGVEALHVVD